jgi:hypothetical protein
MSETIVIDPRELDEAAQHATAMFDAADSAADRLPLISAGVDMPPDVAGRILGMITSASTALGAAAAIIERSAHTLRRVAEMARRADQGEVLTRGLLELYTIKHASLEAGRKVSPRSFPPGAEKVLKGAGLALGGAEMVASVANQISEDARNPFLTSRQRAVRATGSAVESGGTLAAAAGGARFGAMAGGLVGPEGAAIGAFVGGVGAGIGATLAGEKFDIGGKIDGLVDKAFGAADDAADAVGDFVGGIL